MNGKKKSSILIISFLLLMLITGIFYDKNGINDINFHERITENENTFQDRDLVPLDSQNFLLSNISQQIEISEILLAVSGLKDGKHQTIIDENNDLNAIWVAGNPTIGYTLYFRKFYDLNQSWSPVLNISAYDNPYFLSDYQPNMVYHEGIVYIAWTRENEMGQAYDIFAGKIEGHILIDQRKVSNSFNEYHSETIPKLNINDNGKLLLTSRYQFIQGDSGITFIFYVRTHNIGENWNSWSSFIEIGSEFRVQELQTYIDPSNTLHVTYKVFQNNYGSIFYGKNETSLNVDGGTFSFYNVSDTFSYSNRPEELVMKGNGNNEYLYIAFQDINEVDGTRTDILIYNKTFDSEQFSTEPCFSITDKNAKTPEFDFDSENEVAVVYRYQHTSPSPDILLRRNIEDADDETIFSNNAQERPYLSMAPNDDIYVSYLAASKLYYRKVDRTPPSLEIFTPENEGAYSDELITNFSAEADTQEVIFEYKNQTALGDTEGTGNWEVINITSREPSVNMTADLNITWDVSFLGNQFIMMRFNATDLLGLNESTIVYDIIIDSAPPDRSDLLRIYDNHGNDVVIDNFVKENITIEYNVSGGFSGMNRVELRNGTRNEESQSSILFTSTNYTIGSEGFTQVVWETTSDNDGNYTHTFLRAYDNSGRWNDSLYIGGYMHIDNTAPVISEINIYEGQELSGAVNISMFILDQDVKEIICTFSGLLNGEYVSNYNVTDLEVGDAIFNEYSGNWSIIWNTKGYEDYENPDPSIKRPDLNGEAILNITTHDIYGNSRTYIYNVIIDNVAPTPEFLTPTTDSELPLSFMVNFTTDIDTVDFEIRFREGRVSTTNFNLNPLNYFNNDMEELNIDYLVINMEDYYIITANLIFIDAAFILKPDYLTTNAEIGIAIKSVDNNGQMGFSFINVELHTTVPSTPRDLSSTAIPQTIAQEPTGNNTIRVSFRTSINTRDYLLFRSVIPFDVDYLNSLNYNERMEILGLKSGQNFCVANISIPEDEDIPSTTFIEDINVGANRYYYIIVAVDSFGNPSNVSQQIEVQIPLQIRNFESKDIQMDFIQYMVFIGIISAIFLPILSAKITQNMKNKKMKKEIKEIKETVSADDFLDMEVEIDEMEDMEDILDEEVEEDVEESVLGKSAVKKCPNCDWMLSKSATKCPRCGREYY